MYLIKEISISFFITTISASNLYMPIIWSYVLLLDFLIPFLCGPYLQCMVDPDQDPGPASPDPDLDLLPFQPKL
jgi:hypothetical protein